MLALKEIIGRIFAVLGLLVRAFFLAVYGAVAGGLAALLLFGEAGVETAVWLAVFGAVTFVSVGALVKLVRYVWASRRLGETHEVRVVRRHVRRYSRVLLGLVLLAAGASYPLSLARTYAQAQAGADWETRTGRVTELPGRGVVVYEYNVGDTWYTGYRLSFYDAHAQQSARDFARRQYEIGSDVSVYYDPHNPGLSVLHPEYPLNPATTLGMRGVLFAGLGFMGVMSILSGLGVGWAARWGNLVRWG